MCMCMIYKCMMYDVYLISTVHVYVRGASFEGGKNPIIETSQEKKNTTSASDRSHSGRSLVNEKGATKKNKKGTTG